MFSSYQEMYYNSKSEEYIVEKRLELVRYAMEYGIRSASRCFKTTRNTVKRWLRRYRELGKKGLKDFSKAPKNCPRRISQNIINDITALVEDSEEKNKYVTSTNVMKKLNVQVCGYCTVNRYVNKARKKKKQAREKCNNESTEFKKHLKPFQIIQVDIKYLTDIPSLKPYFKGKNLMKYQITARDVYSGFPIVAYCEEKSLTNTLKFLNEVLHPFLKQIPYLDLKSIIIQTDNGKEFTNKDCKTYRIEKPVDSGFTLFIKTNYKKHKLIVPGHCTAQSEVESFHWSIERDCLAWEDIIDNKSLIYYTSNYINEFINKKRYNCDYTPLEKIKQFYSLKNVVLPKPILL